MRKDGNTKRLAKHIVLILGAVIMLVPFIWMFLTAFKTETEATADESLRDLPFGVEDRRLLRGSPEDGFCKAIYQYAADDPGKDHMCGCDGYNGRICFWKAAF